jgi:hypothetical protein
MLPLVLGAIRICPQADHEEDLMAITERDLIRESTHRHAAPNADSARQYVPEREMSTEYKSASSEQPC